jgi:hypothetical protein
MVVFALVCSDELEDTREKRMLLLYNKQSTKAACCDDGHSQVGFGHTRNRLQERVYTLDPTYVRLDIAWKCRRNAGRLRSCEWAAVYGTSDQVPHLSPSSPSPH